MKKMLIVLATLVAWLVVPPKASADTFLQFNQVLFNNPFVFTANGAGTASTITANTQVNVTFDPFFCLVVGCGGVTNGLFDLLLTANSTNSATLVNAGADLNQNFAGTIAFTNGPVNLLTVDFSDLFAGAVAGSSPSLASSQPPDIFTGSSTVFDPNKLGVPRGFALSFSDFTSGVARTNLTLASATADGTGTFNASVVPEPASMLLFGTGLVGLAGYVKRNSRRRRTS